MLMEKKKNYKNKKSFNTFKDAAKHQKELKQKDQTRCEHCGGSLRMRGAVDSCGHVRCKCRKCGRTIWSRKDVKPPIPLVPISKMDAIRINMNRRKRR
jgi:hypothetical protein